MWFDGIRQPNTLYVADSSRGKDSTAMLRAIQLMGWPLDMICSVDIWFDDETPAELPPMVKFKYEYDQKVLDWFGVPVTRLCATNGGTNSKQTYRGAFYREPRWSQEKIKNKQPTARFCVGFPNRKMIWCSGILKRDVMSNKNILRK